MKMIYINSFDIISLKHSMSVCYTFFLRQKCPKTKYTLHLTPFSVTALQLLIWCITFCSPVLAQESTFCLVEIFSQPIRVISYLRGFQGVFWVFKVNLRIKCFIQCERDCRRWGQLLCTFLFQVIFGFGKMWLVTKEWLPIMFFGCLDLLV